MSNLPLGAYQMSRKNSFQPSIQGNTDKSICINTRACRHNENQASLHGQTDENINFNYIAERIYPTRQYAPSIQGRTNNLDGIYHIERDYVEQHQNLCWPETQASSSTSTVTRRNINLTDRQLLMTPSRVGGTVRSTFLHLVVFNGHQQPIHSSLSGSTDRSIVSRRIGDSDNRSSVSLSLSQRHRQRRRHRMAVQSQIRIRQLQHPHYDERRTHYHHRHDHHPMAVVSPSGPISDPIDRLFPYARFQ